MPLEHSKSPAAFKRNVSTLMHEVGKSPHVQSRDQALAIAYAVKRRGRARGGFADGGAPDDLGMTPEGYQNFLDAVRSGRVTAGGDPLANARGTAATIGSVVAPTFTDYMTRPDTPYQSMTPSAQGKLPPVQDTRLPAAVQDIGRVATMPLLAAAPEAAPELMGGIAGLGMRAAQAARTAEPMVMRGVAGAGAGALGATAASAEMPGNTLHPVSDASSGIDDLRAQYAERHPMPTLSPAQQQQIADLRADNAKQQVILNSNKNLLSQRQAAARQIEANNASIAAVNDKLSPLQGKWEDDFRADVLSQQSFRAQHPWGAAGIGLGTALGLSPALGYAAGRGAQYLSPEIMTGAQTAKTMGATALAGGIEGLTAGVIPNAIDMEQPEYTQTYKNARSNWTDPNFWKYGPLIDAGLGAGTSAIAARSGIIRAGEQRAKDAERLRSAQIDAQIRDLSAASPSPVPKASAPAVAPPASAPAAKAGKVWPNRYQDIDMEFNEGAGRWQEKGTGHWVPKRLEPPSRGGADINSPAANSIPAEARGGGIGDPALNVAYNIRREGRAMGGPSPTPWEVRSEARGMMHTGPIMSAVPGRTDHHAMSVPAGAYVLPADHVSSLGQGNTQAGMAVLGKMFGGGGPFGVGRNMPITHGAGVPRPPRALSDKGGARGEGTGHPVPIMAAGGEFVIPPSVVAQIGQGNIAHGHQILDKWVVSNRNRHVATLKKLPGPAKA